MRTPTPSNNAARCAIALLHKFRRALRAYVVGGKARSEQQHERLYRDAIGSTIATHQRRSIGRPATDQFALRGAAADARSTNPDIPAPAEDTPTAEPGSRLNDGSQTTHERLESSSRSLRPGSRNGRRHSSHPLQASTPRRSGVRASGAARTRRLRAGWRARPAAAVAADRIRRHDRKRRPRTRDARRRVRQPRPRAAARRHPRPRRRTRHRQDAAR